MTMEKKNKKCYNNNKMDLKSLQLRPVYSSKEHDLLEEFYNPVLGLATKYDRVTGFFSPRVLAMASRGFSKFLYNGGKIRLLTSIELDENTIRLIKESKNPQLIDEVLFKQILQSSSELEKNYLSIFSYLLNNDQIDMRVACVKEENAIMHEKVGIVTDTNGNKLSFSGSNNETENGWTRNIEQFKVFRSWNEVENVFLSADIEDFEQLWNSDDEDTVTIPVSQAIKQGIIKAYPPRKPSGSQGGNGTSGGDDGPDTGGENGGEEQGPGVTIREYQQRAVNSWVQNAYNGIFEMATGTGKTWTALFALDKMIKETGCKFITIAAPLKHLVEQWKDDIVKIFPQARIITVNSDYPDWREKLPRIVRSDVKNLTDVITIVMTTYASFAGEDYKKIMSSYPEVNACLVADEVHNARTEKILEGLKLFKYKLGLSATPKNEYIDNDDPESKTNQMISLFGGIIYRYPLEEAIGKDLVRYNYYPFFVYLNDEEMQEYERLSQQISYQLDTDDSDKNTELVTALLNKRAMIIKNAEDKSKRLPDLLKNLKGSGQYKYLLIYCDNKEQINSVQAILEDNYIFSSKITFEESLPDRRARLKNFADGKIDCLVARKCLDEGVNIPAARIAILIASNTDQREYIQRLGRILRTYTNKETGFVKDKATVYDFVVLPPIEKIERYRYMAQNEGRRVKFFMDHSDNAYEVEEAYPDALKLLIKEDNEQH